VKVPRSVYVVPVTVKTLIAEPTALPGAGIVMIMGLLNVAEAAPVICISTAAEVEVKTANPVGTGTPWTPEKVAVESAGAMKVNETGPVNAIGFPAPSFGVMTVLGGSVTETVARYPGVPGGAVATVAVAVVAVPFALMVAVKGAFAEGFVTTGAPSSPPPHPPAIINAPNRVIIPTILNNFLITPYLLCYEILVPFPAHDSLSDKRDNLLPNTHVYRRVIQPDAISKANQCGPAAA
jgi:hypothetical protein